MGWNHRLCKQTHELASGEKVVSYGIHEVFYNEDDTIYGITVDPVSVGFDLFEGIDDEDPVESATWTLNKMIEALNKPILDLDTIEYSDRK